MAVAKDGRIVVRVIALRCDGPNSPDVTGLSHGGLSPLVYLLLGDRHQRHLPRVIMKRVFAEQAADLSDGSHTGGRFSLFF